MIENLGRLERTLRMLISVMLLIYGYLSVNYILLMLGFILLASALISWCPIYWLVNKKRRTD